MTLCDVWVLPVRSLGTLNNKKKSINDPLKMDREAAVKLLRLHLQVEWFSSLSMFVTLLHTNTLRGKFSLCQLLDTSSTSGTGSLYFHGDTEPNNMLCMKETEKSWNTHHRSHNTHVHICVLVLAWGCLFLPLTHTRAPTHMQNKTHRHIFNCL